MKRTLYILLSALILAPCLGQNNYTFFGEGNGEKVSMLWTVDMWNPELDGVLIKRRIVNKKGRSSKWELLTPQLIEQYNKRDKELANVSNSAERVSELEIKRNDVLGGKFDDINMKEISNAEIDAKLKDSDAMAMVGYLLQFDYDLALMYGFAFDDYNLPETHALEYGLFPVINGTETSEAVQTFRWVLGDEPDINPDILRKFIKKNLKGLKVEIHYEHTSYDSKKTLAGFNMYRKVNNGQFEKMNKRPISIAKFENYRDFWEDDKITDTEQEYTYVVKPVSVFKNEGKGETFVWSKEKDVTLHEPELYNEQHPDSDFKETGVELKWNYNSYFEPEIKGFVVKRDWSDRISDTLPPNTRFFHDKDLEKIVNHTTLRYEVVALPKYHHMGSKSNRLEIYYLPAPIIQEPIKLKAELDWDLDKKESHVNFNWTADNKTLELIERFHICSDDGGIAWVYNNEWPLAKETSFRQLIDFDGKIYRFTVSMWCSGNRMLPYSDTVSVMIPTTWIPPMIEYERKVADNGKDMHVKWEYDEDNEIIDLKGFRIYKDGELYATEEEITRDIREWVVTDLEPNVIYVFEIQAMTEYGIGCDKLWFRFRIDKKE